MTQRADEWKHRVGVVVAAVASVVGIFYLLSRTVVFDYLSAPDMLKQTIVAFGLWGPWLIVGLMTLAIVVSPLPSAPIALAAGTVYGHTLGTVYVLIGAELGAVLAFSIARFAGMAVVKRWLGDGVFIRLEGSQGTLMAIIFITRLMPFISFDAVSYAAGLTPLAFWRFALATLAGIIPASFLLAHFGAELVSTDGGRVGLALSVLGLAVLIPLLLRLMYRSHGS